MEQARSTEERIRLTNIRFFVPGVPAPAGSKKAFFNAHNPHKPIVTDDSKKSRPWKTMVAAFALEKAPSPILDGALYLSLLFIFPRPKHHFGTGKNAGVLKASAPVYHTGPPDLTKLTRAVEDACNKVLWRDDSIICQQSLQKIYANAQFPTPGCWLTVSDHKLTVV